MEMSKKVKRQAASASFSMNRRFRRISNLKVSATTAALLAIAFATFLYSGGLLTIIEQPAISVYTGKTFYFLYPALDQQFVMDTVFSATLYAMGLAGLIFIYRSTKNAFKPRQAYMGLIVGITLVLLSYIFLEGSILTKLRGA
jgi:predicted neutral ceramidase superfamily lipid hydrolase